jgi:hypothetical protein
VIESLLDAHFKILDKLEKEKKREIGLIKSRVLKFQDLLQKLEK